MKFTYSKILIQYLQHRVLREGFDPVLKDNFTLVIKRLIGTCGLDFGGKGIGNKVWIRVENNI